MKVRQVRALITKGPMSKISIISMLHAIPILKMIHGDQNVQIVEDVEPAKCNIHDEYGRLASKYGAERETGTPWVEKVYGNPFGGGLESAIKEYEVMDSDEIVDQDLSTEESLSTEEKPKRGRPAKD